MSVDMLDAPTADAWVSMVDLARMTGVSKQAVSKRVGRFVEDGALEVRQSGRSRLVNAAAYLRLIKDTTDPAQALRNPDRPAPDAPAIMPAEGPAAAAADFEPRDNRGSYNEAKARKAAIDAENARLDWQERIGNLVRKDQVDAKVFEFTRKIRDRMLGIPATCAERLASAPDARSVRVMLAEEIRDALDSVAREIEEQDQADGVGAEADGDGDA